MMLTQMEDKTPLEMLLSNMKVAFQELHWLM